MRSAVVTDAGDGTPATVGSRGGLALVARHVVLGDGERGQRSFEGVQGGGQRWDGVSARTLTARVRPPTSSPAR
ncbi:hypothetical protein [Microbispora rosea]